MKDTGLFKNYDKLDFLRHQVACSVPKIDKKNEPDCVITVFYPAEDVDNVYKDTVESLPPSESSVMVSARPDPELDPWTLPEISKEKDKESWKDLTVGERIRLILFGYIGKFIILLCLLYLFVCSLDILSSAFRLLGGRAAGEVFRDSDLLKNPVCGLMIGVLATVLVQSSSTSTSIVVSMVASEILDVRTAIPIVMGANIGTSMTNTLVSVAHSTDRAEFRRAFAGATVHDMFNWLTVIVLLPLEVATGYLYYTTGAILKSMNVNGQRDRTPQLLTVLTEPLTHRIIQLDKSKIEKLAMGSIDGDDKEWSLIKKLCGEKTIFEFITDDNSTLLNTTLLINETIVVTVDDNQHSCGHLFASTQLNDTAVGLILLVFSLATLIGCLMCIVKLLHSVLHGHVASVIRRTVNADLPGCWSFLTGYLAIIIGAVMTILVQSSSVFTSALTPLVGIGVLDVARMYPLTLGANVGTTFTSVLAAMASPSRTLASALQISLCHLFFNISGILLFYPIPFMRNLPIRAAKFLGNTTAKYRWFAVVYILIMFFLLPAVIFGLSMAGTYVLFAVGIPILIIFGTITLINILQSYCPNRLPSVMRSWEFLPKWMHSLEPADRVIQYSIDFFQRACPCCTKGGWCCCRSPNTAPHTLPPSESRRKLLQTSTNNSRVPSCAPSCANSPKFPKRPLPEIVEDCENRACKTNL